LAAHRPVSRSLPLWLLVALAPALRLEAYVTLGVRWLTGEAPVWFNPNFPDTALSGSAEQQLEILRGAAAAWRDQSAAAFEFEDRGTSTRAGFDLSDGRNTISFSPIDGGDALAATLIDGIGNRITAFDIVFFGSTQGFDNRWNGPQDPGSGTYDIAGVAIHELGHALGLDHTPIREATMYASATNRGLTLRTLHADDRAGVEYIYGLRGAVDIAPSIAALEPASGSTLGGEEILIRGSNFTWTSDTTLRIGGLSVSRERYDVESARVIRVSSMIAGAEGPADVTLTNEIGTAIAEDAYHYGGPPPQLLEVEPDLGPAEGGIDMVFRGVSLNPDAGVLIGGAPVVDLLFIDTQTLIGRLPPAASGGAVDVELVQGLTTSVLPGAFMYTRKILAFGPAAGRAGQRGVGVDVLASSDEPLTGFSFALAYDPALLAVEGFSVEGTAAAGADFAAPSIDNESGIATFGVVMELGDDPENSIPAGDSQRIALILAAIDAAAVAGTEIVLHVEELAGSPPIQLIFTPAGDPGGVRPFTIDGSVAVIAGGLFIRGDADSNLKVELTDPIFHLSALFQGGPPTQCGDAADSNDDGELDISDAVFTLLYLFSGGPPPPPPYPGLGVDPTADDIDCP
ncbi:MAG: matrixin family metalloprotease, partial [Planctomycetes bacterium]|nr:matrixin family metalloprotease [Planctomycetota bacterium]